MTASGQLPASVSIQRVSGQLTVRLEAPAPAVASSGAGILVSGPGTAAVAVAFPSS